MQDLLIRDNRPLLEREPHLTEIKFVKMARSPYEYLRGTPAIFAYDMTRPGVWPSQYITKEASVVVAIGDAHPENIGAYRNEEGTYFFDFNDFDGMTWGPYHLEVRRLSVSFATVGIEVLRETDAASLDRSAALSERVASGYVAEINDQMAGEAPIALRPKTSGSVIVEDVFGRSKDDGTRREELSDYTVIEDGRRTLRTGVLRLPDGPIYARELWAVSADEERMVRGLVAQWHATTVSEMAAHFEDAEVVAVRRRIGAGVSSYPILRYYALLQGASQDVDDVAVLDIKESRDGLSFPGIVRYPARVFGNNAERTVEMQRAFQEFPDADPMLGWASFGAMAFRIQDTSKFQKDVDVARIRANIRAKDWSWSDLETLAYLSGRLLARGHAKSLTANGVPGLPVIHAALHGDDAGFVAETAAFTRDYLPRLVSDYEHFVSLLDLYGPLLGYRATVVSE